MTRRIQNKPWERARSFEEMGTEMSHSHLKSTDRSSKTSVSIAPSAPDAANFDQLISEEHKALVIFTWKRVEENITKVGVITFLNLFETHPDVQSVFLPFNNLAMDELRTSKKLEGHALKVMSIIQKVIARIDKPKKLYSLLYQLGKNHYYYGAKQNYIELVGPQFVNAIAPMLKDVWTEEAEIAWLNIFSSVSRIMKKAMEDTEKNSRSMSRT